MPKYESQFKGTEIDERLGKIPQMEEDIADLKENGGGIKEEKDPTVPAWAKAATKPSYSKSEVGLANVDNVKQYSASNPPPYPVTSVNGQTGAVNVDVPTKTSEITNDSGFVTKTVTDLANYYLKSESYTKTEVNSLISAIPKFSISVVSSLPTSNISATTIYLVGGGNGSDLYTEYIYVNNSWEILGAQKVDLTGYATENWVNTQIAGKVNVTDIVNNLTTNASDRPLSAAQGAILNSKIENVEREAENAYNLAEAVRKDATAASAAAASAHQTAHEASISAQNASDKVDDLEERMDSGEFKGEPGADGYSPTVAVSDITNGKRISITDKNGTKNADIMNGSMGKTAYEYAQDGGFTGTEEQFAKKLAAPFVTPQMYGAKGDGVTNDTAAIQAALNASSYIYIPDGTYMIYCENNYNGGIFPKANQTIILSENAVLKAIKSSIANYTIVNISNVSNVHICGGKIQGEKAESSTISEFGYGIFVNGGQHITIENMEIWDCRGDAILIGYSSTPSKHVVVDNCVLHDCYRQGVSVVGGEYLTIKDCEIYNIRGIDPQYGIDIEPDGSRYARNIVIDNCYIHDNAVGSVCVAATTNELRNVKVINCVLADINFQGTISSGTFTGGKDCSVNNCKIGTAYFYNSNPVRVSNSIISKVYLAGGTAIIDNCDIVNSTGNAIDSVTEITGHLANGQKSNLHCSNCRLSAGDVSSVNYLIKGSVGNATYGAPDETFEFKSCTFELGTNRYLQAQAAGKQTIFDGCRIVYNWTFTSAYYGVFNVTQGYSGMTNNIIVKNTVVECAGTVAGVIAVDGNKKASFDISNSSFTGTTRLANVYSGSTANIKVFNSGVSSTATAGGGAITTSITNNFITSIPSEYVTESELTAKKYLTAVPSEYVTETELAAKGYLTTSTLPKYDGGVS